MQELIEENREQLLKKSKLSEKTLEKISKTNQCNEVERLRIAIALDIPEDEIAALQESKVQVKADRTPQQTSMRSYQGSYIPTSNQENVEKPQCLNFCQRCRFNPEKIPRSTPNERGIFSTVTFGKISKPKGR